MKVSSGNAAVQKTFLISGFVYILQNYTMKSNVALPAPTSSVPLQYDAMFQKWIFMYQFQLHIQKIKLHILHLYKISIPASQVFCIIHYPKLRGGSSRFRLWSSLTLLPCTPKVNQPSPTLGLVRKLSNLCLFYTPAAGILAQAYATLAES